MIHNLGNCPRVCPRLLDWRGKEIVLITSIYKL